MLTDMIVIVLGVVTLRHMDLVHLMFDPTEAEIHGLSIGLLHYLLPNLLAVIVVIAIQTVGIVLVRAMLVSSSASTYLLARRFPTMLFLGTVQGIIASIAGLYLSFYLNVTSGAALLLPLRGIGLFHRFAWPRRVEIYARYRGGLSSHEPSTADN